ncbi:MAG: hypothetical protein ACKVVT_11325 [Dehalococcoidia bacterium]
MIDYGIVLSRVHIECDLLTDFELDAANERMLSAMGRFATTSAHVVRGRHLRLACSVYVHEQTFRTWSHVFKMAALMQVEEAQRTSARLATSLRARVDASSHPVNGHRDVPDEMLQVVDRIFVPVGADPSVFYAEEFELAERAIGRQMSVLTTASDTGLTSELAFGRRTALVRMRNDVRHPTLGAGLMSSIALPLNIPKQDLPGFAIALNTKEQSENTRAQFVGSWCAHDSLENTLAFVCFLPNICVIDGIVAMLLQNFAMRVGWARGEFLGP